MSFLAEDGALSVAPRSLSWVAKNVFLISPLDCAGDDAACFGFELTSVDSPHFSTVDLASIIQRIVCEVHESPKVLLRRDHFTRYPLEGYGDVLFESMTTIADLGGVAMSSSSMVSLQERLLSAGIARIIRPGLHDIKSLIAAEAFGLNHVDGSWSSGMASREQALCRGGVGTVVDVVRGDLFRICVEDVENVFPEHVASQITAPPYFGTVLAKLKGVECSDTSTDVGFLAWRYSQNHFFGRRIQFVAYSFSFSDHDISNNTQEVEYHLLQHIEISAVVLSPTADEDKDSGSDDLEESLLVHDLATMIRLADAAMPRALNFHNLLRIVDNKTHCSACRISSVLDVWSSFLLDGDVMQDKPVHRHGYLPLKLICSMRDLIAKSSEESSAEPLGGFISSFRLVNPLDGTDKQSISEQQQSLVAIEVCLGIEGAKILKWRQERRHESLGELVVFPDPRGDVEQVFGKVVDVEVRYDPLLSGIETSLVQVEYCCTMYEDESIPDTHRPADGDFSICSQQIRLQLPANARQGMNRKVVFVLDLRVKFSHTVEVLRRRETFALCASGRDHIATKSANIDDDAADIGARQDDEDDAQQPQPSSPTAGKAPSGFIEESGGIHPDKIYHAYVDFYFPLQLPSQLQADDKIPSGAHELSLIMEKALFRAVRVAPRILVEVCGRRGFSGKLVFEDDGAECTLGGLMDLEALNAPPWCSAGDTPQGAAPTISSMAHLGRFVETVCARAESAHRSRLINGPLGRVPSLVSFALFPRMFFASHPKHHRSLVPEADHKKVRGLAHLDAAFMRLHFPRLPNLFRMNWERLPFRCRDAQQMFFLPRQDPMSGLGLLRADERVVAHHLTLSKFLALIASILPRRQRSVQFQEYQANIELGVTSLCSTGLLCVLDEACHPSSPTEEPPRRLFFGSKAPVHAIVEDDVVAPANMSAGFISTLISILGAEVVTELAGAAAGDHASKVMAKSEANDYSDRVLGQHGQGHLNLNSPHHLYSPVRGLAVIGDPLVDKNDTSISSETEDIRVRHLLLRFTPLRMPKNTLKTYRVTSYGQLSREVVYNMAFANAARGRDLVDYMDLLLHQSSSLDGHESSQPISAAAADGILRTFGSAHEPLHVLYTSRAALRFSTDLTWKLTDRPDDKLDSFDMSDVVLQERALLDELWTTLETALRLAAAGGPAGHAFFVAGQSFMEDGMVELSVYPREEVVSLTTSDGVEVTEQQQARRFAMRGNVFGRLACRKVIIKLLQDEVSSGGGGGLKKRFSVTVRELRRDVAASQRSCGLNPTGVAAGEDATLKPDN